LEGPSEHDALCVGLGLLDVHLFNGGTVGFRAVALGKSEAAPTGIERIQRKRHHIVPHCTLLDALLVDLLHDFTCGAVLEVQEILTYTQILADCFVVEVHLVVQEVQAVLCEVQELVARSVDAHKTFGELVFQLSFLRESACFVYDLVDGDRVFLREEGSQVVVAVDLDAVGHERLEPSVVVLLEFNCIELVHVDSLHQDSPVDEIQVADLQIFKQLAKQLLGFPDFFGLVLVMAGLVEESEAHFGEWQGVHAWHVQIVRLGLGVVGGDRLQCA